MCRPYYTCLLHRWCGWVVWKVCWWLRANNNLLCWFIIRTIEKIAFFLLFSNITKKSVQELWKVYFQEWEFIVCRKLCTLWKLNGWNSVKCILSHGHTWCTIVLEHNVCLLHRCIPFFFLRSLACSHVLYLLFFLCGVVPHRIHEGNVLEIGRNVGMCNIFETRKKRKASKRFYK